MRYPWGWLPVLFLLQSALLPFWWPSLHLPDLWLATVVLWTVFYGPKAGIYPALLGGLVQDIVVGNFFSLHLAGYLLVWAAMIPAGWYLRVSFLVSVALIFLAGLIFGSGVYLVLLIAGEAPVWGTWLLQNVLPLASLTCMGSIPFYYIYRPKEEREY